jgi:putative endonuclease
MSNKSRSVLYIGITGNFPKRISSHACGCGSAFTKKYNLTDLIYFEEYQTPRQAIEREKQLKNWKRQWKLQLIQTLNPAMENLWHG